MEEEDEGSRRGSAYERKTTTLVSFHPDNSEPTDGEFNDIFNRYNTATPWFILMFILSCLPTLCIESQRSTLSLSKNIEGNCIFPNLLKRNWTMRMVMKFTQPENARLCRYLAFDYKKIERYSFMDAMDIKNNSIQLPPTKTCAIPVTPSNYSWTRSNFLKTCTSMHFKANAQVYRVVGEVTSALILGLIGDIWGRKIGLWLSFPVLVIGMILLFLADHYYILCAGYFFEGFGYVGWSLLSYVLFLELCNPAIRGILSLYLTCLGVFAKIFGFYIEISTPGYFAANLLSSLPSISLLLYLYYVPESPRWLLSYGRKKEAWQLLETLAVDVSKYAFLPRISLSKVGIILENYQILLVTKKYLRTLFGIGTLLFVDTLIYEYKSMYIRVNEMQISSHRMILILSDVFSFFNVLPPFIIFGRYICILTMHFITMLYLIINLIVTKIQVWFVINMLAVMSVSSTQFVILLYYCELIPTCARTTGLGLAWIIARLIRFVAGYVIMWSFGEKARSLDLQNYIFFGIGVLGIFGIIILPNYRVYNLPDFKRYRNVIET